MLTHRQFWLHMAQAMLIPTIRLRFHDDNSPTVNPDYSIALFMGLIMISMAEKNTTGFVTVKFSWFIASFMDSGKRFMSFENNRSYIVNVVLSC